MEVAARMKTPHRKDADQKSGGVVVLIVLCTYSDAGSTAGLQGSGIVGGPSR